MIKTTNIFFLCFLSLQLFNIIFSYKADGITVYMTINFVKEKKSFKDIQNLEGDYYMSTMMYTDIFSPFNVGVPRQKLKLHYDINSYYSILSDSEYFKSHSTTYKLLNDKDYSFNKEMTMLASKEIVEIHYYKLNEFNFLLSSFKNPQSDYPKYSYIGLNFYDNTENNNNTFSFLEQIKKQGLIEKKIFAIYFGEHAIRLNRAFDGQILFGVLPHDISNEFDEEDLKWISLVENGKKGWKIKFDKVLYNNETINANFAQFDLGLNVIIAPENVRKIFEKFLKKFIDNKNCVEDYFYSIRDEKSFLYYSCDRMTEFGNFPKFSFYSENLNEIFEFSLEKLVFVKGPKIYFSLIFDKTTENNWRLGAMFFEKYRFIFDSENKMIGYYKTIGDEDHPWVVVFSLLGAIFVFVIFWLQGSYRRPIYQNMQRFPQQMQKGEETNYQYKPVNKNDGENNVMNEKSDVNIKNDKNAKKEKED